MLTRSHPVEILLHSEYCIPEPHGFIHFKKKETRKKKIMQNYAAKEIFHLYRFAGLHVQ